MSNDTFAVRSRHPVTGRRANHWGADMHSHDSVIRMPFDQGTVVFSGKMRGYGNVVVVQSADGSATALMAHLKDGSLPAVGTTLSKGQAVATEGATGRVTGKHLHFEVAAKGEDGRYYKINPRLALGQDLSNPAVRQALLANAATSLGKRVMPGTGSAKAAQYARERGWTPERAAMAQGAAPPPGMTPEVADATMACLMLLAGVHEDDVLDLFGEAALIDGRGFKDILDGTMTITQNVMENGLNGLNGFNVDSLADNIYGSVSGAGLTGNFGRQAIGADPATLPPAHQPGQTTRTANLTS